jgi:hypothetical protein
VKIAMLPQSSIQKYLAEQSWWGTPITFINLRMLFVLAWTNGHGRMLLSPIKLPKACHFVPCMVLCRTQLMFWCSAHNKKNCMFCSSLGDLNPPLQVRSSH